MRTTRRLKSGDYTHLYVECLRCAYVGSKSARYYDAKPPSCPECGARLIVREQKTDHRPVDKLPNPLTIVGTSADGRLLTFFEVWG